MSVDIAINEKFQIEPCEQIADIEGRPGFTKIESTPEQKIQMLGLLQQMPAIAESNMLSGAYRVKFPEGIPSGSYLMQYEAGGLGTPIKGPDGKTVGHASMHKLSSQMAIFGAVNAMSIASGQYFLSQINDELKIIKQKMDEILEFLHGEKKAELISEVSFVKYAYQNYISIMEHNEQRLATIISLQEARKVAMKDIEFYISEMESCNRKKSISALVDKRIKLKEPLDLSMQLYALSYLLEIYYSQNYDASYICNIEEEIVSYIRECENHIFGIFNQLRGSIRNEKETLLKKIDKESLEQKISPVIDYFGKGAESELLKSIHGALHTLDAKVEYYVNDRGDLYLKT